MRDGTKGLTEQINIGKSLRCCIQYCVLISGISRRQIPMQIRKINEVKLELGREFLFWWQKWRRFDKITLSVWAKSWPSLYFHFLQFIVNVFFGEILQKILIQKILNILVLTQTSKIWAPKVHPKAQIWPNIILFKYKSKNQPFKWRVPHFDCEIGDTLFFTQRTHKSLHKSVTIAPFGHRANPP